MIEINGCWWPDDVGQKWQHSLRHLASLEIGLTLCSSRRSAVQAGGNIGLWPARLARSFERVYTFEPDRISLECLKANVPENVVVSDEALGSAPGVCGIHHKSLGSHRIEPEGSGVAITTIDALGLQDLDFLQLDIEGYEAEALAGGAATIERCHPIIQIELRGFSEKFGHTDAQIRERLQAWGYQQALKAPGADFIFRWSK